MIMISDLAIGIYLLTYISFEFMMIVIEKVSDRIFFSLDSIRLVGKYLYARRPTQTCVIEV